MKCIVTGAAGFIGYHLCEKLLSEGYEVVGIDNLNTYYATSLKQARLDRLEAHKNFRFYLVDIAEYGALAALPDRKDVDVFVHLAAQAGVRNSLVNPFDYVQSNLVGQVSMLEFCRHAPKLQRIVYASSSSVYGDEHNPPFHEDVRISQPKSLYAATKAADELLSASYSSLFDIPQIGLRFFTVYGAWGRPDMAYWIFADKILKGEPIQVFNHGKMRRDFTYIDDIIAGLMATITQQVDFTPGQPPHKLYNIGNNRPIQLMKMIETIEDALGIEAQKDFLPMQAGDVKDTCADISAIQNDFGFQASTPLEVGLPKFVEWFRDYRNG
ncbi:NAD-dependent epimerase/dehydratase family protein [Ponticaulis profundi]|uniref:NAD-dependent epimerase/dehydratase family protein n=1 Tax=Ponticaulis profundi TaxID=2665222 RepID=A0ABW1SDJ3_9PROT